MRQHVNLDHVSKGAFQVSEDIINKSTNSIRCTNCRKWFSKTGSGIPRQNTGCDGNQEAQPFLHNQQQQSGGEGGEGSVGVAGQPNEGAAAQAKLFADWLNSTTHILQEFNAAVQRGEADSQQSLKLSLIQHGSKQPNMPEGTQHLTTPECQGRFTCFPRGDSALNGPDDEARPIRSRA